MVRIKERYLLVNILYPSEIGLKPGVPDVVVINQPTTDKLTPQALLKAIRAEVGDTFGDFGSGALEGGGLQVKYLSNATSTFILRITRAQYRMLWTALTFMDHVPVRDGKPCTFRVVHVSGTIRKVEAAAIQHARNLMFSVKDQAGEKEKATLEAMFGQAKRTRQAAAKPAPLNIEDDSGDEDMVDISDD
ncbi:Rpp14 family protein [Apiospora arundinis]|uniref:Ribonuclease P/MRP protein subunit POP5 n=1 Tax=Apiospora arundinis TaxID=335852 RepID=A0ABR2IVP2_9PEZI